MQFALKNWLTINYKEDLQLYKYGLLVLVVLLVSAFGIFTQFPNEHPAEVFSIMLAICFILLGFSYKGTNLVQTIFLGEKRNFFLAIIAGTIVGYVIHSTAFAVVGIPTRLAVTPYSISNSLNFFYVVILAAIAETTFFRGVLFPQVAKLTGNVELSALVVNGAFGGYHFIAYGGDYSLLLGATLFGFIGTVGSSILKSLGFEYAAHFIVNFLTLNNGGT